MSDIVCKDDGTVEIYYNSYYDPFEKQQYEGGVFSYNIGEGGKAFNDEYIPISQVKGMTDALAAFKKIGNTDYINNSRIEFIKEYKESMKE